MSASYYDALLPVREPGADPQGVLAGIRLPYRVLASICIPGGRVVVAFISDSVILSRMFAANWAQAKPARRRTQRCTRWPGRPAATDLIESGTVPDGGRGTGR